MLSQFNDFQFFTDEGQINRVSFFKVSRRIIGWEMKMEDARQ